ncbi:HvfC family RiPP maturation protein [Pseudoxanthomonas putridarboris]|uniref:DNA-binding domain-containing protein n=1 Tax=Pseudoxanthomonas putridarboris TaxID=752605 RepID=A0ABU9IY96_9GAMM
MADTLREQQFALSRHLRDPQANPPPPGIEDRRLAIYRDLFYNNIEGLLAGNFPVIRKTLGDERWHALVRRFYADHRSRTPLFPELAREFIRYLEARAGSAGDLPAWLMELAHYEWVELALQIADDAVPTHDPNGDLLAGIPVLSPFAWALAYQWPVHRIGPGFQPTAPPPAPTLVLVRRDATQQVRFAEISPLVYRLVERLGQGGATGEATLRALAAEAGTEDVADFLVHGTAMLERMREEGTVLGTRPA